MRFTFSTNFTSAASGAFEGSCAPTADKYVSTTSDEAGAIAGLGRFSRFSLDAARAKGADSDANRATAAAAATAFFFMWISP